jgi:hypothetical protein
MPVIYPNGLYGPNYRHTRGNATQTTDCLGAGARIYGVCSRVLFVVASAKVVPIVSHHPRVHDTSRICCVQVMSAARCALSNCGRQIT